MSAMSRNRPRPTSRQRSRLAQKLAQGLRKRGWTVRITYSVRHMASPHRGSRRWRLRCRQQATTRRRHPVDTVVTDEWIEGILDAMEGTPTSPPAE